VNIPTAWRGQHIQLQFDAVSYHLEAEVNDMPVGSHTGSWTPFAFDITDAVRPGMTNTIALTVYKPGERFPVRESLAGFLPDVCLPFGGLWQSVRLVALPGAAISDLSVLSDLESGEITVRADLHNAAGMTAIVRIYDPDGNEASVWEGVVKDNVLDAHLTLDSVQPWSPDKPALYRVAIRLDNTAGELMARVRRTFGFRTLSQEGSQLLLNGSPIFLRGILNWGWYPEILCPAPDEKAIRDEFRRVRSFGYNMVKLCLNVPSPLYFDIADQEGMLLWLELPLWQPQVTDRLRQQVLLEYADILANAHHHPSIVIYSLGCELSGAVDSDLLRTLNDLLRAKTNGILACDNSGSGEAYDGLTFDYADFNDYHFYCDLHYFNPLLDHFRRDWRPARPWLFGEFCDADDYRDVDEIGGANDGQLPWWLVEQNPLHPLTAIAYSQQRERMNQLNLPFDGQQLQHISRQQSFVVRKTILEKVRSKAGMGGYVVTGLRDTPVSTSSMFDDLGRPKYDADLFREFNADAVLLLEQGRHRIWKYGGDRPAPKDRLNHFAATPVDFRIILSNGSSERISGDLRWKLIDAQGQHYLEGKCTVHESTNTLREIAAIQFRTPPVEFARQYTLTVELNDLHNQWPLWVYPAVHWPDVITIYDPAGTFHDFDDEIGSARRVSNLSEDSAISAVLLTSLFTPEVSHYVREGGRAILLQGGVGGLPAKTCPFWREAINLLYDHPVLEHFPHQGYMNLQFYHLATDHAFDTARLMSEVTDVSRLEPIIRRLDARQFTVSDYLVDTQLGAGRLLASTLRFGGGAGDQVGDFKSNVVGQHLLSLMFNALAD
jgi:hypothetical protein